MTMLLKACIFRDWRKQVFTGFIDLYLVCIFLQLSIRGLRTFEIRSFIDFQVKLDVWTHQDFKAKEDGFYRTMRFKK